MVTTREGGGCYLPRSGIAGGPLALGNPKEDRMQTNHKLLLAAAVVTGLGVHPYSADAADAIQRFGPVGVTRSQLVRVNVVALGGPDTAPSRVTVAFVDVQGAVIKRAHLEVAPGATGFATVAIGDAENLPSDSFGRRTLRAEIANSDPQADPAGFMATLEIFHRATGRTTLFIGNPNGIGNPDTLPSPGN
jgi:hypothetical protein